MKCFNLKTSKRPFVIAGGFIAWSMAMVLVDGMVPGTGFSQSLASNFMRSSA